MPSLQCRHMYRSARTNLFYPFIYLFVSHGNAIEMEFPKARNCFIQFLCFKMNLHKVKWKPLSCWLLVQIIQSNFMLRSIYPCHFTVIPCDFGFVLEFQFLLSMFILSRILSSSSSSRKLPLCFGCLTAQITDRIKNASHMKRHAVLSKYVPFQNVLESLFNLLTERAQDYHAFSFADPTVWMK